MLLLLSTVDLRPTEAGGGGGGGLVCDAGGAGGLVGTGGGGRLSLFSELRVGDFGEVAS